MTSRMLGIDASRSVQLETSLRSVAPDIGAITDRILDAEARSELSTGTIGRLDEIGRECAMLAATISAAAEALRAFRLPLRTGADRRLDRFRLASPSASRLDPFRTSGARDFSFGESRRERWLELTRLTDHDLDRAEVWGAPHGLGGDDAALTIARYRALDDLGLNDQIVGNRRNVFQGVSTTRTILRTEARRVFIELELRAAEEGWSAAQTMLAHDAAIASLTSESRTLGWRNSDETSLQLGVAFAALSAKARLGDPLPTLTAAEVDEAIAAGSSEEQLAGFATQVRQTGAAISQVSDANLARGLRLLSTSADAALLLAAAVNGDEQLIREVATDFTIGTAIATAARWLLGRAGGPVGALAALVLATTEIGPPSDRPVLDSAPRVGATDAFGVLQSSGPCMTASGNIDTVACDS